MSNLIVVPNKKEEVKNILQKDIKGIILGIENLSTYEACFTIEEAIEIAKETDKEVIIAINKMIHNSGLPLVKIVLEKIKDSKIDKILFYDLGIYNMAKKMNIKKDFIIGLEHLNASIDSNKFYYEKEITSTFITSDITYREILDIKENTKMKVYYTVYGYLPIFYSRRRLLTNYFKYIDKEMKDNLYYIKNNELLYMIKEREFGTIIYSPLINLINELEKISNLDYFVIDLSFTEDINIIDDFLNHKKVKDTYIGFFDTKTTYKVKGDKNEKKD